MAVTPEERRAVLVESHRLFSKRSNLELEWVDRQKFLQSRGYMLRSRYRPEWVPSWQGLDKLPIECEDGILLPLRPELTDATRISDGKLVYIKRVKTGDQESRIATMLSSPPLLNDPANHCVRVLDLFQDEDDAAVSYMVMPFLRLVDDPPFETVWDLLDLATQLLEVSANDSHCSYKNLMMDADALFPNGFHPIRKFSLPDGFTPAPWRSRKDMPIKYYYVDFGISVQIPPNTHAKLAVGPYGRDQEVPELSADIPYDPFKVDIFIIGNFFRRNLYDVFSNVDFFLPLIESMTRRRPESRPTAEEALSQWQIIRERVSHVHRAWRPRRRDEFWIEKVAYDTYSLFEGMYRAGKWLFNQASSGT
ncbi:hypothetical protein POSPLADRAFT_1151938 [Postia placenta MAD-698-R-SB12]|uniref:Protein kinase domain-containing protein n=1 Tax=Postia placenta MAD-698-R-SB12 TaxID=670580 RepID=A0A1X6MRC9_9APHY|nr:hypothetical protein POSPLADRAFT_1151938 [Postia placenta MAD-698-R-SB12]OSX58938.1 hypothetical protein POSPLADRAFT_1151938 [Postia placenta MAD-698-R-SB12]